MPRPGEMTNHVQQTGNRFPNVANRGYADALYLQIYKIMKTMLSRKNIFVLFILSLCQFSMPVMAGSMPGTKSTEPASISATSVNEVLFPLEFQNRNATNDKPVARSMQRANVAGKHYLKLLQEKKPFSGFYASGDYTRSMDGNGYSYSYGVEWELYDQGRNEAKRDLDRTKLESLLHHYQLQNQMRMRRQDEKNNFIHRMEDTTASFINSFKQQYVVGVLTLLEEKYKKGYMTQEEIIEWRFRSANLSELKQYYTTLEKVSLHPETLRLLNRLHQADLKPAETLIQMALQRSIDLKIQELLKKKSNFFPRWKDNVSLRFFVERRRDFNIHNDNVAGVRLRLPIGHNGKRKEIIRYEQMTYGEQASAITARLKQRIRYLHSQFYFHRTKLRQQKNSMRILEKKLEIQKEHSSRSVPSLKYTPEKAIRELTLQKLDLYKEALMTRLKMYSLATEIESLVLPRGFREVFLSL